MRNLICRWPRRGLMVAAAGLLASAALGQNAAPQEAVPQSAASNGATPVPAKSRTRSQQKPTGSLAGMGNTILRVATQEEKQRYALSSSYFAEGNGYLDKNKPDAAIAAFQQVQEVDPTVSVGLEMGEAYAMKGQWLEAIKWYRKDIYPQSPYQPEGGAWRSPGPMLKYAMLLLRTGQTAEAATIYNASLYNINQVGPGFDEPEPTGKVLLPLYDSSLDNDPKLLEALVHVGLCTGSFRYVNSLAEASAAIRLVPGLAIAHYFRAVALSGKIVPDNEAVTEYRRAAELGDDAVAAAAQTALKRPEFKSLSPASGR